MRRSEFSGVMVDLNEEYRDRMWNIAFHGKKAYKLLGNIEDGLDKDINEFDYVTFSKANNELKETFENFRDLIGNIIYTSENKESKENFKDDIKTINKNLDLVKQYNQNQSPNKKFFIIQVHNQMVSTLRYMLLFLKRVKEYGEDFRTSVVDMMELMGGKQIGKTVIPPSPDKDLLSGLKRGEEGERKVEESEKEGLTKEGMEAFLETEEELENA